MSQQYHIQSETTKYYLATAFQKEGELVFTSDGEGSIPEHSVRIQLSHLAMHWSFFSLDFNHNSCS